MRGWTRLVEWAEQDRLSASFYVRVSQAAAWFAEGSAGLWRNPELELGLRWRRDESADAGLGPPPRRVVRSRDGVPGSERAGAPCASRRSRSANGKRKLRQAQWTAAVFGVLFLIAGVLAYVARQENLRATDESPAGQGSGRPDVVVGRPRSGERRRRRPADGGIPAAAARKGQGVLRRLSEAGRRQRNATQRDGPGPSPTGPHRSMARERRRGGSRIPSRRSRSSRAWRNSLPSRNTVRAGPTPTTGSD